MIPEILDQHLDELSFLVPQRALVVGAPHFDLHALAHLDERLDAHLDALRVAGSPALDALGKAPADPGLFFAAFALHAESNAKDLGPLIDHAATSPVLFRAATSALGWLENDHVSRVLDDLIRDDAPPVHRALGWAGCSAQRRDPGAKLTNAVLDADPRVRARAIRAAGDLGRTDLLRDVHAALKDKSLACQFWAAASGLLLGDSDALASLWDFAQGDSPFAERACLLAVRRTPPKEALDRLRKLDNPRTAIIAAGVLGDPAALPWLLENISNPKLARIAGDAITKITGIRLEKHLVGKAPAGFVAGPNDNPADPNVALDPDADRPWPALEALTQACRAQTSLIPGNRYLLGKPLEAEWLRHVLVHGKQPERASAAMEMALDKPGTVLFEVRAPARNQIKSLPKI